MLVKAIKAGVFVLEKTAGMQIGKAWDDPALGAILRKVRSGRLEPGLELIRQAREDHQLRALRVDKLADAAKSHTEALARLAGGDPDGLLWLGAARIQEAWAIRGGSYAKYVGEERFTRFLQVLGTAEEPLRRAADLLPADPVPWNVLQWHAIGMGSGRTELDRLWKELIARNPGLYAGHHSRTQALCEKWYGSHAELLAFAAETVAAAEPGDPVVSVLPMAHIEIVIAQQRDREGLFDEKLVMAHFSDPAVAEPLIEASDKWLSRLQPHPLALEARHLFGAAFYYGGHLSRAQGLLAGAGRRMPDNQPWTVASLTPARRYAKARRELGL